MGFPRAPALTSRLTRKRGKALSRAIGEVFQTCADDLRGRRLDANDFNRLVGVDVDRDTLRWMSDPKSIRDQMDDRRWEAFCAEARRELGFDPAAAPDVEAGARLAEGKGRWGDVWSRFNEAPEQFRGVAEVLGRSRPSGLLVLEGRDRWPDLNEEDEQSVHDALVELPDLAQADACRTVQQLEKDHGARRGWVWARLGCSPLAEVLRPLACLAAATEKSICGASPDDIARVYAERGWQADRRAREALALAPAEHEAVVAAAIRHLHAPWLDESAQAFQAAVTAHPLPSAARSVARTGPVTATEGECVVFVDGLRNELGRCLADRLEECGRIATVQPRWAAIPTVTATAKPVVTPVTGDIAGDHLGADFGPVFRSSRRPVTATALRGAMKQRGYEIVGDGALELVRPLARAAGWRPARSTGIATISARPSLRSGVNEELDRLVHRVTRLLDAGWRSVRIVTDHGWLLFPGGLPMVTLPRHLTASKWARCAVLAGGARPEVPLHPWHWNQNEYFASPAGIACFSQRPEYAHGGLSVQECLTPEIRVREKTGRMEQRGTSAAPAPPSGRSRGCGCGAPWSWKHSGRPSPWIFVSAARRPSRLRWHRSYPMTTGSPGWSSQTTTMKTPPWS